MTIEAARDTAQNFLSQLDAAIAENADLKKQVQSLAANHTATVSTIQDQLAEANKQNEILSAKLDVCRDEHARAVEYMKGLIDDANQRANKYQALTISLAKGAQMFQTVVTAAMTDLHSQAAKALVVPPADEPEKSDFDELDKGIEEIAKTFAPEKLADTGLVQPPPVQPTGVQAPSTIPPPAITPSSGWGR